MGKFKQKKPGHPAWVSGSGENYLPLAADISVAAKCAVLLPDYRLAPEHPFPAGLDDCVAAHDWLIANGPSGPGPAKATFIAGVWRAAT